MEFPYNNSYQSTIDMSIYEALYGKKSRMPLCWDKVSERKFVGPELTYMTNEKIKRILERIKIAQSRHKFYSYKRNNPLEF